jgi:hypothetical protein
MEDSKPYGVTMLVTPPTPTLTHLGELTVVAHTTEAGQQRYYKAEQVEALFAAAVRPWISTELLPVLPADSPVEYWVAYPDGTVGALYFGYRIEMDENWDDEEPYTGWMYEGTGEGLSTYSGPQPLFYKEMEAAPVAPTMEGSQPRV